MAAYDEYQDHDGNDPDPAVTPSRRDQTKRERDYVVPATNARGNNVRAMCRVPPEMMRIAADVVASKKYPFRVMGDLFRYCISIGLEELAAGAGIKSVRAQAEIIKEMNLDEEYYVQFTDVFRQMKTNVERHLENGEVSRARVFLHRVWAQIKLMPKDAWQKQYEDEFLRKYGNILDGGNTPGPAARYQQLAQSQANGLPAAIAPPKIVSGFVVSGGADDDDDQNN